LTYGFLVNQLWSFAGDEKRSDVNQMFLQPFFTKSWKSGASVTLNSEINFNWETNTTSAYFNPIVSSVTKLGTQIVSLSVGPRIPLGGPESIMADWGLRGVATFVFPK
jgi:Ni,Fe-hydrogenase I cytochrome b subunit